MSLQKRSWTHRSRCCGFHLLFLLSVWCLSSYSQSLKQNNLSYALQHGSRLLSIVDTKNYCTKDTQTLYFLSRILDTSSYSMNQNFKNVEEGDWFLSLFSVFIQFFNSFNLIDLLFTLLMILNFILSFRTLLG